MRSFIEPIIQKCHLVCNANEKFYDNFRRTHCCGKQGVCLYKRPFCFAKCLLGIPKPFVICIVPLQAARSCRTLFDGVHGSVIYPPGADPLKKVPTMILSAPTMICSLFFDVRYVIDICVQNIGCSFLLPRCKTAQLPVQLIIRHIRCWGCGVPD